ncbi:MAG: hypothetical protein WC378_20120 [Opitutaceae bacterium]|jgi:hypothetical protein
MLPRNSLPQIKNLLIVDYLKHDNCREAVLLLERHFAAYDAAAEIRQVSRRTEDSMGTLLEDCMLLVATSAPRPNVLTFIHNRIDVSTYIADCIRVRAEFKWISQYGI